MTSNFPNGAEYAFTSDIPEVFTLSGLTTDSVIVELFLLHTEKTDTPVFSTTLYAYGGKVQLYDLRSLAETYLEEIGYASAPCRLHFQEEDRTDTYTDEFRLVYSRQKITDLSCKEFLQSHFLTTLATRLVPRDYQLDLYFCVLPGEECLCSTTIVLRPDDGGPVQTYTIAQPTITATAFKSTFDDLSEDALLNLLPEGVSGTILSATVQRGRRTFTLFFTDRPASLLLVFQNEFNVSDSLPLTALTKRTLTFDRQQATCCGKSSCYDDRSLLEYESQTALIAPQEARHLTQALQSPSLFIFSDDYPHGTSIVVTDIESELSDAPNAQNRITFKWKPVTAQPVYGAKSSKRIFNANYNNVYR